MVVGAEVVGDWDIGFGISGGYYSDEIVHHGNLDVSQKKNMVLY